MRDEIRQFCVRCFADDRNGSWGEGVHGDSVSGTLCANCGAMNSALAIPTWAVESIREQASWVGKRFYPHEEDYERSTEVKYLRSIAPPPESTAERCDYGWNVTQGRTSTIIKAPTAAIAKREAALILPYPIPDRAQGRVERKITMSHKVPAAVHLMMGGWATALRSMSCMGVMSPSQRRFAREVLRERPQPGDLVAELSTIYYWQAKGLGWFERETVEPLPDWFDEEPNPGELVYYIRRVDTGEVVRWTNASFMRLPRDTKQAEEWLVPEPMDF